MKEMSDARAALLSKSHEALKRAEVAERRLANATVEYKLQCRYAGGLEERWDFCMGTNTWYDREEVQSWCDTVVRESPPLWEYRIVSRIVTEWEEE
jgi:hypothetical protein